MHSWDTETIDLEVREESPVGNGHIICAQMFCGPDAPFENGPMVLVDNFGDAKDTLLCFKEYFESPMYKKCWFNYGFDRHVFMNHGIDVQGFAGDVMQMARLLDSSREPQDYSLARISRFYAANVAEYQKALLASLNKTALGEAERRSLELYTKHFLSMEKTPMSKLFARRKRLQNGTEGRTYEVR